jgi:hypothetical protein
MANRLQRIHDLNVGLLKDVAQTADDPLGLGVKEWQKFVRVCGVLAPGLTFGEVLSVLEALSISEELQENLFAFASWAEKESRGTQGFGCRTGDQNGKVGGWNGSFPSQGESGDCQRGPR